MASTPETKSTELRDMLTRLEEQMRRMQDDIDARLDAIAEGPLRSELMGPERHPELANCRRVRFDIPTHKGKPRFRLMYRNEPSDGAPAECLWLTVGPRAGLRAHRIATRRSRRPT